MLIWKPNRWFSLAWNGWRSNILRMHQPTKLNCTLMKTPMGKEDILCIILKYKQSCLTKEIVEADTDNTSVGRLADARESSYFLFRRKRNWLVRGKSKTWLFTSGQLLHHGKNMILLIKNGKVKIIFKKKKKTWS